MCVGEIDHLIIRKDALRRIDGASSLRKQDVSIFVSINVICTLYLIVLTY